MKTRRLKKIIAFFGLFLCMYIFVQYDDSLGRFAKSWHSTVEVGKSVELGANKTSLDKNYSDATVPNISLKKLADCTVSYICTGKGVPFNVTINNETMDGIKQLYTDVKAGGSWEPTECIQRSKVALILPYRDRQNHLRLFIRNIIPFLQMQNRSFTIFLIEQTGEQLFNKAQLMNAGFIESQKLGNYSCFIFHDIDMIPVNLCNVYECPKDGMRHLGLSRDLKHPHYVYGACIGGGSAFTKDVFHQINGFTNVMFGWGGEDDDGYFRLNRKHIKVHRHPAHIGNYYDIFHEPHSDPKNPHSYRGYDAIYHNKYMDYDGLNTVNYTMVNITTTPLYTKICINIPGPTTAAGGRTYFNEKKNHFQKLLEAKQSNAQLNITK